MIFTLKKKQKQKKKKKKKNKRKRKDGRVKAEGMLTLKVKSVGAAFRGGGREIFDEVVGGC